MKPFDLKAALEGAPLITRDGKHENLKVYEVNLENKFPLKVEYKLDDTFRYHSLDGIYYGDIAQDNVLDLFMQEDSDLVEENEDGSIQGHRYFQVLNKLDLAYEKIENLENKIIDQIIIDKEILKTLVKILLKSNEYIKLNHPVEFTDILKELKNNVEFLKKLRSLTND